MQHLYSAPLTTECFRTAALKSARDIFPTEIEDLLGDDPFDLTECLEIGLAYAAECVGDAALELAATRAANVAGYRLRMRGGIRAQAAFAVASALGSNPAHALSVIYCGLSMRGDGPGTPGCAAAVKTMEKWIDDERLNSI